MPGELGQAVKNAASTRCGSPSGICLVVERDPIHLAKNVATLDCLSGGRFVFGIGGGWNAEEMANHGTAFKTRFALMRERIEAMKVIWANDVAEYHGEHVSFEPLWAWPKPVQKPHPPIIVGGEFPHGAKRAIAYGDGWMPIAEDSTRCIPVVVLTSCCDETALAEARSLGAVAVLPKLAPFDALLSWVNALCR